jgi:predicted NBD/HSP70 family sugar kinase
LFEELTDRLAEIYAWIIALIRPDHITLAGEIVDLGDRLIERIRQKVVARLPADAVEKVTLSLTETAHTRTIGAVAFALQQETGILA